MHSQVQQLWPTDMAHHAREPVLDDRVLAPLQQEILSHLTAHELAMAVRASRGFADAARDAVILARLREALLRARVAVADVRAHLASSVGSVVEVTKLVAATLTLVRPPALGLALGEARQRDGHQEEVHRPVFLGGRKMTGVS